MNKWKAGFTLFMVLGLPFIGAFYHIGFDPNETHIVGPPAEVHHGRYSGWVKNDTVTVSFGIFDKVTVNETGYVTVIDTPLSTPSKAIFGLWISYLILAGLYTWLSVKKNRAKCKSFFRSLFKSKRKR